MGAAARKNTLRRGGSDLHGFDEGVTSPCGDREGPGRMTSRSPVASPARIPRSVATLPRSSLLAGGGGGGGGGGRAPVEEGGERSKGKAGTWASLLKDASMLIGDVVFDSSSTPGGGSPEPAAAAAAAGSAASSSEGTWAPPLTTDAAPAEVKIAMEKIEIAMEEIELPAPALQMPSPDKSGSLLAAGGAGQWRRNSNRLKALAAMRLAREMRERERKADAAFS